MQLSKCVQALHAEYAQLALAGKRSLNADQARSIAFYRAELAFLEDPAAFAGSTNQIVKWVQFAHEVESFVVANGRLPHKNNRLAPDIDSVEGDLAERVRYRQGRAVRTGRLCEYQRRRHACIPGFREHPREADWDDWFQSYQAFIRTHRRAPAYRRADVCEKRLADWAVRQRAANREGKLSPRRKQALSRLTIWTWGK